MYLRHIINNRIDTLYNKKANGDLRLKDIKTFFRIIHQVNYILNQKQKIQFIGILFLGIGCALVQTLGVSAILPFIQAILTPEKIMNNEYVKPILSMFHITNSNMVIVLIGIGIILVYLLKNLYLIVANYIQTKFRCRFHEDISTRLLNSYLKRPYSYFITTTSSAILQAIQNDSNSVYDIMNTLYQLVAEGVTIILLGILLAYSDLFMAVGVLVVCILCFLFVTLGFKKKLAEQGIVSREAKEEQYKYLYQPIMGNKDIKVMQRSDFFVKYFKVATKKVTKTTIVYGIITSLPEKIIETVCVAGIIGIVCVRLQMGVDVMTFIPQLSVFAIAAFRILPSISKCAGYLQTLVFYRPSMEAAYSDMVGFNQYEEACREYYALEEKRLAEKKVLLDNVKFQKELVIDNIGWKYDSSKEQVISGLSLTIKKGEAVAFIGSSGAGKTTLADIILGLLKPQQGNIYMDGVDIFAIPMDWSKIIGYVPQSVFLIDDTIRANVTFGLAPDEISDEAVWEALGKAQIKDYVMQLPEGLDTMVGERGIRFSGGQRQRIAIARALYHDPDILVLDEATSALDGKTENALMEAIDHLHGSKTLIIIAHRLSTIRNCDKIFEISNGQAYLKSKEQIFG